MSVVVSEGVTLRLEVVVRERRSRTRRAGSDEVICARRSLVVVSDGTEKHNVECCEQPVKVLIKIFMVAIPRVVAQTVDRRAGVRLRPCSEWRLTVLSQILGVPGVRSYCDEKVEGWIRQATLRFI